MAFEIITGPRYNAVAHGVAYGSTPTDPVAAVAGAGTFTTAFPITSLYDGVVSEYARFSDYLAAYSVDIAANLLINGDGERSTGYGWTGSGASITTDATHVYKGAKSLKVTASVADTTGYAYQDVTVAAGAALGISWGIGWPTAGDVALAVYDTRRAQYLTDAGVWQDAAAYVAESATGDFAEAGTLTFSAPSVTAWGDITGTLQVRLYIIPGGGGGTASAYGEVVLFPTIDFVGLFGHNVPPNATITLSSAADWFSGALTTRATFASVLSPVAWYAAASALAYPWYRLTITYPNSSTAAVLPYIGELVLGRRLALSQGAEWPVVITEDHLQSRADTPSGVTWVAPLSGLARRTVSLAFEARAAGRQQIRDYVAGASRGGASRAVLVPTELDAEVCVLGRIQPSTTYSYHSITQTAVELVVIEEALPTVR